MEIVVSVVIGVLASTCAIGSEKYALLIGVSDYPTLKREKQLNGPKNDVVLLRKVLRKHGFDKKHIRVLADGVKGGGRPTRNAIIEALDQLVADDSLDDGDFLFLYFSGHGSQQPVAENSKYIEPDGLDEIYLPSDIGKWDDAKGVVKNAITDNEIGEYILKIREKNVFVWIVFDHCYSGTMTRAVPVEERDRAIEPEELGVPQVVLDDARASAAVSRGVSAKEAIIDHGGASGAPLGGFVGFAASQSYEKTPEKRLPRGHKRKEWYGLFTYTLAEVLTQEQAITYEQAEQRVFQRYAAQNIFRPTPLFEGTHRSAGVFNSASSIPTRQWPIMLNNETLTIDAGILHQIGKDSIFAIVKEPGENNTSILGYLTVVEDRIASSDLLPIDFANSTALPVKKIPQGAYARLIHRKISMDLRIAKPGNSRHETKSERKALAVLDKMEKRSKPEGVKIKWVTAGEDADLRLILQDDRLWFLSPNGELVKEGQFRNLSVQVKKSADELEEKLRDTFQSIGKVQNLARLTDGMAEGPMSKQVEMSLYVNRHGRREEVLASRIEKLKKGDLLELEIRNNGVMPIDLTLLFIDSQYGIVPVYPSAGYSNRIEVNGHEVIKVGTVNAKTVGLERLAAIVVQSAPNAPRSDFSFLQQKRLPKDRSVNKNGVSRGARQKLAIDDLFIEAGFGKAATRGLDNKQSPPSHVAMKLYIWEVAP